MSIFLVDFLDVSPEFFHGVFRVLEHILKNRTVVLCIFFTLLTSFFELTPHIFFFMCNLIFEKRNHLEVSRRTKSFLLDHLVMQLCNLIHIFLHIVKDAPTVTRPLRRVNDNLGVVGFSDRWEHSH